MVCDTYCRKITASELRKTFPKTDYIRVLYLSDVSLPSIKTRIFLHYSGSRNEQVSSVRNYLTGKGKNDYGMSLDTGTLYTAGPTLEEQMALFSLLNTEYAVGCDEDGDPGQQFKVNFGYALKLAQNRNELDGYRQDAEKFRDVGNARAKVLQEQLANAQAKTAELEAEVAALKANNTANDGDANVGQKRARDEHSDLLASIQQMMQTTLTNTQMEALKQENSRLQESLAEMRKEFSDIKAVCTKMQKENSQLQKETFDLKAASGELQWSVKQAQHEKNKVQKSLEEVLMENGRLGGALCEVRSVQVKLEDEVNDLRNEVADARVLLAEKEAAVDAKEMEVQTAVAARDLMQQKLTLISEDRKKLYKRAKKTTTCLRAATTLHLRVRDAQTLDQFEDVQRVVEEYLQTVNRGNYLAMPKALRTTHEMLEDAMGPDENDDVYDVSDSDD